MRDMIEIGCSPYGEECAQVGAKGYDYRTRALRECAAFVRQLRRHAAANGVSLDGVDLRVKANSHDFGTYYEVTASFEDSDEKAQEAAYWLEADTPEFWDDVARGELGLAQEGGHFQCNG